MKTIRFEGETLGIEMNPESGRIALFVPSGVHDCPNVILEMTVTNKNLMDSAKFLDFLTKLEKEIPETRSLFEKCLSNHILKQ